MNNLAKLIIKNRKIIIVVWSFLLFISSINLIFNKAVFESGVGEVENSISKSVNDKLKTKFRENISGDLIITISAYKYKYNEPIYLKTFKKLENLLLKQKEIIKTLSFFNSDLPILISNDQKTTVIFLETKEQTFQFYESYTKKLREVLSNFIKKNKLENDFKIYLTGNAAFSYDMNTLSEQHGKEAELKVFILTFLVLVFAFGSVWASSIAVLSGFTASILTISLLKIITIYFNLSVFCQNVSTMLGLGLSIDYSLLMITRYRKELQNNSQEKALINTISSAGLSVVYSGFAVFIGFLALFIPNLKLTSSIAIGGIIVVLFSVLAAITLTTIILHTFSNKIKNINFSKIKKINYSEKWCRFVVKNSFLFTSLTLILLLFMGLPATKMKLSDPEIRTMPDLMESKLGFNELQKISAGDVMFPVFILVESKNGSITDSNNLINLFEYLSILKKDKRVSQINSIVSFKDGFNFSDYFFLLNSGIQNKQITDLSNYLVSKDKKTTLFQLFPKKELKSFQINNFIKDLRKITNSNLNIEVGGPASISYDLLEKLYSSTLYIVTCVYFVTFILLCYAFKSLLIPIKAIIMNTISLFASYGILVLIFQYNIASWLVGLKYSPESLLSGIPVILFCIMFSLSMDYEVFLLSRIYEDYLEFGDNEKAIIKGLSETGGVITKASIIMIIVFGAFTQADIILIKMLGAGLAIAILIDATLIRMILVPGFMKLTGKFNWYFPKI